MPSSYSEDSSVEQPAIDIFKDINWSTIKAPYLLINEKKKPEVIFQS
jgi:hypothetical protein